MPSYRDIFLLRSVTTIKCWVLTSQKNLRFRPTRRQLESMLSVSMLFGNIKSFFSICLLYVFSSYFYFLSECGEIKLNTLTLLSRVYIQLFYRIVLVEYVRHAVQYSIGIRLIRPTQVISAKYIHIIFVDQITSRQAYSYPNPSS